MADVRRDRTRAARLRHARRAARAPHRRRAAHAPRFAELAARLSRLPGVEDLSLSTNAVQLKKFAGALYRVERAPSQRRPRFTPGPTASATITGGGRLDKVLGGLMAAKGHWLRAHQAQYGGAARRQRRRVRGHGAVLPGTRLYAAADRNHARGRHRPRRDRSLSGPAGRALKRLAERFELLPAVMPGGGPAMCRDAHVRPRDRSRARRPSSDRGF